MKKAYELSIVEYKNDSIAEVLKVFERKNTAGRSLNLSELIVSNLSALWKGNDNPKHKLEETVKAIQRPEEIGEDIRIRFKFDRNFVLRACFMLTCNDIRLSFDNINEKVVDNIENNWDAIVKALGRSIDLLEEFGFGHKKLTAKLPVLPIAYYFMKIDKDAKDLSDSDKNAIQRYLYLALFKRLFRHRNTDTTLKRLKEIIDQDTSNGFPLETIKDKEKFDLNVDAEYIESLLKNVKYGGRAHDEMPNYTQVLYLISPDKELYKQGFDVDHIFPRKDYGEEDFCDTLPNLQLLTENKSKSSKVAHEWYDSYSKEKPQQLQKINFFPDNSSHLLKTPPTFIKKRTELLKARLEKLLQESIS